MVVDPAGELDGLPAGLQLAAAGDLAGARQVYAVLWAAARTPVARCGIAHATADVQTEPILELLWDLRALTAAQSLDDSTAAAFRPSLHLNLADVYSRLGASGRVATHVAAGRAALDVLPADGYLELIRSALDRVERGLVKPPVRL